jgi:hypothetical protein
VFTAELAQVSFITGDNSQSTTWFQYVGVEVMNRTIKLLLATGATQ